MRNGSLLLPLLFALTFDITACDRAGNPADVPPRLDRPSGGDAPIGSVAPRPSRPSAGAHGANPAMPHAGPAPIAPSAAAPAPAGSDAPVAFPAAITAAHPSTDAFAGLDEFVIAQMNATHVAGLAATVARDGHPLWTNSYGYADAALGRKVTDATRFGIGSVSKVVTAVAALQLVEQGKLALDADLAMVVPFPFRNPKFADKPITLRHLLTHTSSLVRDFDTTAFPAVIPEAQTATMPLKDAIEGVFTGSNSYRDVAPGTQYEYSNLGASVVGYIVERVSGEKFEDYVAAHVYRPLGMNATYARFHEYVGGPGTDWAMPYSWEDQKLADIPLPTQADPFYPCGEMLSTPTDLALLFGALAGGGTVLGHKVLESATVDQMLTAQLPGINFDSPLQGLIVYGQDVGPDMMIGHAGNIWGSSSDGRFRKSDHLTVVVLVNADAVAETAPPVMDMIDQIEQRMVATAGGALPQDSTP
jgi:CubicO group peptidase (beta-lactamase class C family)